MNTLLDVAKSWPFALCLGLTIGIIGTLIVSAFDRNLVRLKPGMVITEKRYIDGLVKQIERLMEEIRQNT